MKLILISHEAYFKDEIGIVCQLFEHGLTHFHLRKPDWSLKELESFLGRISSDYHNRIVLHDHYELTQDFRLKGIHYNIRNKHKFQKFVDSNLITSGSFHAFEALAAFQHSLDYAFLGPIFDSISKDSYKSAFDKSELIPSLQTHQNIIALGGVDVNKVDLCHEMGFEGIAVLGAVWQSTDPIQAFKKLREACQKHV